LSVQEFLARDSIQQGHALCDITCPSVCLSVTRVDHRIMKFSPYGSPIPLVLWGKFHPENLTGSGASNKGEVGENKPFSNFKREFFNYL